MTIVANKSLKKKEEIIRKLSMDYRKNALLENNCFLVCEDGDDYSPTNKKDKEYFKNLKSKVDFILEQLDGDLYNIIYNEYFAGNKDKWWVCYYTRSTYYRLKNKALDSFLEWWYV